MGVSGFVIAVTGMPGSGKSTVARMLSKRLGCPLVSMGDAVRREVVRRGLPLTVENVERIAMELRRERGKAAVAYLVRDLVREHLSRGAKCVIVDGLRSLDEAEVLREAAGGLCIVAVHASPSRRLERLLARGREDDVKSPEDLRVRDEANLSFGIGEVIALADYMIVNEWGLEELASQVNRVVGELVSGSWKSCSRG